MSDIKRVYFGPAPDGVDSDHAGHSYFVEDGWKIELIDGVTVRLTRGAETFVVKDVPFEVVRTKKRPLQREDFQRMNLPPEYWNVQLSKVPESARQPVQNYLSQAPSMIGEGLGFVLTGGPGVGKTSIAALLAIEARRLGQTVFFTTISDLRELIRNRVAFDQTTSILERCREVGFLVLDNLRPEDAREHPFDGPALEGLLENRVQWKRSTVVTTRMKREEVASVFKNTVEILRLNSPVFPVNGANQRESESKQLLKRLMLSTDEGATDAPASPSSPQRADSGDRFSLPSRRNKK